MLYSLVEGSYGAGGGIEMKGSGARVRRAGLEDVAGVVGLSAALFREDAGSRDPCVNLGWPAEEGWEYFAGMVGGGRSLCLVAEEAGEMVGYLAGRLEEGTVLRPVDVAELESMYVMEGWRGKGVGAGLVEAFLGWAESRGAERASVVAYAANERAIRFYARYGFLPRRVCMERGAL